MSEPPERAPLRTANAIAAALRTGHAVEDEDFDHLLPVRLRRASRMFWTPLPVVARVAAWLAEARVGSVVDLGAGAGKFCVAAALMTSCRYTGIEHRARLVAAAGRLARELGVADRVDFVLGRVEPEAPPVAGAHPEGAGAPGSSRAYYLYNPFGENRFGPSGHLDEEVELGDARYRADVAAVEAILRAARPGTYVVTYNGFGGEVPEGYTPVRVDRTLPNMLEMWVKSAG